MRAYMRLQERKQRAFEAEHRRRTRIFAIPEKKKKNGLSALRRKFLGSSGAPIQFDPGLVAVPEDAVVPRRPELVRSYEPRQALTRPRPIVAASLDPVPLASRLPIVGKGKTRIPCFRR
jgi:hypothetical protein